MAKLPDIEVLESRVKEGVEIYMEDYRPNLTKQRNEQYSSAMKSVRENQLSQLNPQEQVESLVQYFERKLYEDQVKYRKIYELREPFEEAKAFLQQAPRKGFFQDKYKRHKKAIKAYEDLLDRQEESIEHSEAGLLNAQEAQRQEQAFQNTLLSPEKIQTMKNQLQTIKGEHNASKQVTANAARNISRVEAEAVEEARARLAEYMKRTNENYNKAIKSLMEKGGADKKTRKRQRKSKKTRKQ